MRYSQCEVSTLTICSNGLEINKYVKSLFEIDDNDLIYPLIENHFNKFETTIKLAREERDDKCIYTLEFTFPNIDKVIEIESEKITYSNIDLPLLFERLDELLKKTNN